MDGSTSSISISPDEIYAGLGAAAAPLLIDVRRPAAFAAAPTIIASAFHRPPDEIERWRADLPCERAVVVYCVHGHEVSQGAAAALRAGGIDARYLEDSIEGWIARKLPTRRKVGATGKWITRERPKIDRIACPWLISRFIDPAAQFIYAPAQHVLAMARAIGATPYDVDGVEFTREGERCSFDTILRIYEIREPALDRLATIVRGADTSRHDLSSQYAGLLAISLGLSANFQDDHAMLAHGMVVYDALHTWCRSVHGETHN
jgi:rhodanese-related sulfurtransferase